jgi:hypothetical protein
MHEHGHALAREVPRAARVVEVDVRHDQSAQVARGNAQRVQLRAQTLERHRAPALDEHGTIWSAHDERRGGARDAEVPRVELVQDEA